MKSGVFFLVAWFLICSFAQTQAQNTLSQNTQVEIGVGFVLPYFLSGQELLRSKDLRDAQKSYYASKAGLRADVGEYSRSTGFNFSVGFYKPIRKVKGLMAGALVRNAQTGSTPQAGGYEEAYFFNFITAGFALKYYPFPKNNLYIKTDLGIAAVLTKNRFINEDDQQHFFH